MVLYALAFMSVYRCLCYFNKSRPESQKLGDWSLLSLSMIPLLAYKCLQSTGTKVEGGGVTPMSEKSGVSPRTVLSQFTVASSAGSYG